MTTVRVPLTERIPRPAPALVRGARAAHTLLARLFVGGVVLQVFLAGLALLVDAEYTDAHRALGHVVLMIPYGILAAAAGSQVSTRSGKSTQLAVVRPR